MQSGTGDADVAQEGDDRAAEPAAGYGRDTGSDAADDPDTGSGASDAEADGTPDEHDRERLVAHRAGEQALSRIDVLHVDDDEDMLELSRSFLEREDERLEIRTATGAREGLSVLGGEADVDVVVSDYQMPGMDGLEFLEAIRERAPELPFIVFTGRGREEVAVEAVNLGADRYLQKGGDPLSQFGLLADAIVQEARHKRAREQLRESEERYRTLVETFPDIVFITDYESRMLYANPALERQTGLTVADFQMAQAENPFIHPADADRVAAFIAEFVESDRTYSDEVENRFIDADGDLHWYSSTIAKVTYEGQAALQFITREVTERKRREERLRENQRRYRTLAAAIPDTMVAVFGEDLTYVDVPGVVLDELGVEAGDLAGSTVAGRHPGAPLGPSRGAYERVFDGEETTARFERDGHTFERQLVPVEDDETVTAGMEITRRL